MSRIQNLVDIYASELIADKILSAIDANRNGQLEITQVRSLFSANDISGIKEFRSVPNVYANISLRLILTTIISLCYDAYPPQITYNRNKSITNIEELSPKGYSDYSDAINNFEAPPVSFS